MGDNGPRKHRRIFREAARSTSQACDLLKIGWSTADAIMKRGIEAVALDRWPAFLSAVKTVLPGAAIVYDRFHISKHLNEGVNKVRAEESFSQKATTGTRERATCGCGTRTSSVRNNI